MPPSRPARRLEGTEDRGALPLGASHLTPGFIALGRLRWASKSPLSGAPPFGGPGRRSGRIPALPYPPPGWNDSRPLPGPWTRLSRSGSTVLSVHLHLLMMTRAQGAVVETACGFQPKAEGVGRLWAGPKGRCAKGALWGTCGLAKPVHGFSMGFGAVHGLSMPEHPRRGCEEIHRRNPRHRDEKS
jgi:hypothetical protein